MSAHMAASSADLRGESKGGLDGGVRNMHAHAVRTHPHMSSSTSNEGSFVSTSSSKDGRTDDESLSDGSRSPSSSSLSSASCASSTTMTANAPAYKPRSRMEKMMHMSQQQQYQDHEDRLEEEEKALAAAAVIASVRHEDPTVWQGNKKAVARASPSHPLSSAPSAAPRPAPAPGSPTYALDVTRRGAVPSQSGGSGVDSRPEPEKPTGFPPSLPVDACHAAADSLVSMFPQVGFFSSTLASKTAKDSGWSDHGREGKSNPSAPAPSSTSSAPTMSRNSSFCSVDEFEPTEEQKATMTKKELRMLKNRESAARSRKRKRDIMERLEEEVRTLRVQNRVLKAKLDVYQTTYGELHLVSDGMQGVGRSISQENLQMGHGDGDKQGHTREAGRRAESRAPRIQDNRADEEEEDED